MKEDKKEINEDEVIDTKNINIYQKIQKVKFELSKRQLPKTGENKFSNFKYYQLEDILPSIIEICNKYNLFTHPTFTNEDAILEIINSDYSGENPDLWKQVYTSPMKDVEIKGANAIQCLGGAETYQRRYLYMMAFDITEGDIFDENIGKDKKNKKEENNELILLKENVNKCQQYFSKLEKTDDKKAIIEYLKNKGYNTFTELQAKKAIEDTQDIIKHFNIK